MLVLVAQCYVFEDIINRLYKCIEVNYKNHIIQHIEKKLKLIFPEHRKNVQKTISNRYVYRTTIPKIKTSELLWN